MGVVNATGERFLPYNQRASTLCQNELKRAGQSQHLFGNFVLVGRLRTGVNEEIPIEISTELANRLLIFFGKKTIMEKMQITITYDTGMVGQAWYLRIFETGRKGEVPCQDKNENILRDVDANTRKTAERFANWWLDKNKPGWKTANV
jgi:hypothetical protein